MTDEEKELLAKQAIERDKLAKDQAARLRRVQENTQHQIDNTVSANAQQGRRVLLELTEKEMLEKFAQDRANLAKKHFEELERAEAKKPQKEQTLRTQPEKLLADEKDPIMSKYEREKRDKQAEIDRQNRIKKIMENAAKSKQEEKEIINPVDEASLRYEKMRQKIKEQQEREKGQGW